MASVKLLVKKHNVSKKDGKSPIYVQYNYSRDKRILINTNRRIELKFWDFDNDALRRSHPKYDNINLFAPPSVPSFTIFGLCIIKKSFFLKKSFI